jgi:hypothetical protein
MEKSSEGQGDEEQEEAGVEEDMHSSSFDRGIDSSEKNETCEWFAALGRRSDLVEMRGELGLWSGTRHFSFCKLSFVRGVLHIFGSRLY